MENIDSENDDELPFRIPKEIKPFHYELSLEFDWQQTRYMGSVIIHFKILRPLKYIPIHAKKLSISTEFVARVDHRRNIRGLEDFHSFPYQKCDYWVTSFPYDINEGEYQIRLRFHGNLGTKQLGIFTVNPNNNKNTEERHISDNQIIIATRMHPIFARMAFPCFDEPDLKATFDLNIIHPDVLGYQAISNMKIKKRSINFNKIEVDFKITPPISPHMLGFVLTSYAWTSHMITRILPNTNDFELRIFAEKNKLYALQYALNLAIDILKHLIHYFHMPYPLAKLDLIALPHYIVGAQQFWGLIIFDERMLLYDPEENSNDDKQRIAHILTHELVQIWLGNLVTLTWWDDLWLFEGFASYMEYKCLKEIHNDWEIMDEFLILETYPMMAIDAFVDTRPLFINVEDTRHIYQIMDEVSFKKSAILIRMVENLIGANFMHDKIKKCLVKYAYQSAEPEDLIEVLEADEGSVPISKIMKSFKEQQGLPFITVHRDKKPNSFIITQQRFLSDPEDYKHQAHSSKIFFKWTIPISYFTNINATKIEQIIFERTKLQYQLTIQDIDYIAWIKCNKDNIGYYRVNYSDELWLKLIFAICREPQKFSIADRTQLLSDAFAFGNAGILTYKIPLDATVFLEHEHELVPWYVAAEELKNVEQLLRGIDCHKDFLIYAQNLIQNLYQQISWTVELQHQQNLLRITILDAACAFGLPAALDTAAKLFSIWIHESKYKIRNDLKGIVLFYGMKSVGKVNDWEIVWERFLMEKDPKERSRLLRSLTALENRETLVEMISLIQHLEDISDEDFFKSLTYISCNSIGSKIVWNYVQKTWPELLERFGKKNGALSQLIPDITKGFKTIEQLDELNNFLDENPINGISNLSRNKAITNIEYKISWLNIQLGAIKFWLQNQLYEESFHSAQSFFIQSQSSEI